MTNIEEQLEKAIERAEKAEAACADIREWIGRMCFCACHNPTCTVARTKRKQFLETDFGQGWLSPEKAKVAMEALDEIAHGNTCRCARPIETCDCVEQLAKETIAKLKGEKQ